MKENKRSLTRAPVHRETDRSDTESESEFVQSKRKPSETTVPSPVGRPAAGGGPVSTAVEETPMLSVVVETTEDLEAAKKKAAQDLEAAKRKAAQEKVRCISSFFLCPPQRNLDSI